MKCDGCSIKKLLWSVFTRCTSFMFTFHIWASFLQPRNSIREIRCELRGALSRSSKDSEGEKNNKFEKQIELQTAKKRPLCPLYENYDNQPIA